MLTHLESAQERIRTVFSCDSCGFLEYFAFWEEQGGDMKKRISGIDRARRARSGTSLGIVLDAKEANPFMFFNNFHVFSVFFAGF